jgi:hypothetical protein
LHRCSLSNPCHPDDQISGRTTHAELIKYAGVLHAALQGVATKCKLKDQYKLSWKLTHLNELCDWEEEGNPLDHSEDDTYPGSTAPSTGQLPIFFSMLGIDCRLPACLIMENPEHTVKKDAIPGSYLSQENLDPEIYDAIASCLPGSIQKLGRHSEPGKVSCVLPT